MEVVPLSVGRAARAWDEQHLDVAAAAGQIGDAPTGGFTGTVAGAATRFVRQWARHAAGLADDAEARADALRTVIADYLATDEVSALDALLLLEFVEEQR